MFKVLYKQDISTRKFRTYKNWAFDETTTGSLDVYIQDGVSGSGTFHTGSEQTNSIDGSYKRLIWSSIQHIYYPTKSLRQILDPRAYLRNFIDIDKIDLVTRSLSNPGIRVMNIPVKVFGEEIKPTTFLLETGSTKIIDDGNYNIYISGTSPRTVIGNIFYQYGHIIITSQSYTSSFNHFDVSFQSVHEIYENEVYATAMESEFNYTVNPTAYHTDSVHYIPVFSASLIKPYICQVGLYNEQNELLVVGKFPRPYRQDEVLDTTFLIRWDN